MQNIPERIEQESRVGNKLDEEAVWKIHAKDQRKFQEASDALKTNLATTYRSHVDPTSFRQ